MSLLQYPKSTSPDTTPSDLDLRDAMGLLQAQPGVLALTDGQGRLRWGNPALLALLRRDQTACRGQHLTMLLALPTAQSGLLDEAIGLGRVDPPVHLQVPNEMGTSNWFGLQVNPLPDGRRVVMMWPADEQHQQRAEIDRLSELLEVAQDLGRLGVWERNVRSLKGRFSRDDHHLRGHSQDDGAPDFDVSMDSIVEEDRAAAEQAIHRSMRKAGRYSQRYRVQGPDGAVRHVYSQWDVKSGSDGRPERAIGVLMDDTENCNLARVHGETVEQLSLAVELGHIAVWRSDLRTACVHVNDKGLEALGLPAGRDVLSFDEVRALIHPDDVAPSHAATQTAIETGAPIDIEIRARHRDGSWRHFLTRRMVQRDAQGEAVAVVAVGLDLSDRIESSRRQSERMQQFELTARTAGIGYWSFDAATGRVRWSEQVHVLHGLPLQSAALALPQWLRRFVHRDDRRGVLARIKSWVRGEAPSLELHFRIVRDDGTPRHVLSHTRLQRTPGQHQVYGLLMDVTERRAAESALRDAHERSALATRGAGLGTWEMDPQTGAAIWDEQMWRLRGLQPRAEVPNHEQRLALVHPDDREATRRTLRRSSRSRQMSNLEFRVRWPDGQWRWLASRSISVLDKHTQKTKRIGVNWDITDTRTAQLARQERAAAQQQSQARSQFLSRMSHELRTPLNAVLGFAQLLLVDGERATAATRKRRLEQVHTAGKHLLALIDDVLDLSSMEGGEMRISKTPVPLEPLVAETLNLVERQARQMKLELRTELQPLLVLADATRLRQVLLNLLTNAVKYNREGGSVTVQTESRPPSVLLRVADTGRGMSEAQLAHVFEPFNRLGLEREDIEGTGIGLSIVKALVERMGGTVRVSSNPGRGSVFEVQLPDASHEATTPVPLDTTPQPLQVDSVQGQSSRLLYIEDNAVNLLIVQELVALRPDLTMDSATCGLAGIEQAVALQPDLILVDMQLPDIDGFEVLRRLHANPATAHIRCVAVSANALPDDIKRARRAGFADYWTKPLDFKLFMKSLDSAFGPLRP